VVDPRGHHAHSLYGPKTALLVVDVQNDFAHPSGSLYVPGGETVVTLANREVSAARAAGAKVAYTQDWHPPETPHFVTGGGVWPVHCVRNTWGAEFHADLLVTGEVVRKGTGGEDGYSGFGVRHPVSGEEIPTRLATVLRAAGIETDYCVRETAADALELGFRTVILEEAVAAVDLQPGDGRRALEELAAAGAEVH
jgi:nicotinamidase/pyrazinamidase